MENNGFPYGVFIDVMLPAFTLNQCPNMEYNKVNHNLLINGDISTSKNSSVSTLTSPSVTSTNDEVCSIFSIIHEKFQYSDLSKT